jgi:anti-sigma B factor antagonist
MHIKTRARNGVTILDLNGKIDDGDVALRRAVQAALGDGASKFLLNLGGVMDLDLPGVSELVVVHTMATNRGARIKLENLPPGGDILSITQLITVFEVFDDEDDAVASFA